MKNLVNRKNGYLEIENSEADYLEIENSEADIKEKMYYMLEKINDLENKVQLGKMAENELKTLNEEFKKLCKKVIEEH